MVVVDQDQDLAGQNLETTLLEELGLGGWPVFVVSLGRSTAESSAADAVQDDYKSILSAALSELEQRSMSQVVLMTSGASLKSGSELAAQSDLVSHLIYRLDEKTDFSSRYSDSRAGIDELRALAETKVGLVDLVPPTMDKKKLAMRKRTLAKAQMAELHRYIIVPGFEESSNFQIIAKRLRAWMKENRRPAETG